MSGMVTYKLETNLQNWELHMWFRLAILVGLIGFWSHVSLCQILYELQSPEEVGWGFFGCSVASMGDINNDGYDDVIVGAEFEGPGEYPYHGGGRVHVFSGRTGEILHTFISPNDQNSGRFGSSVSGAGDVNGDGTPDAIIGACWEDLVDSVQKGGQAYVFSGASGTPIHTLTSPFPQAYRNFGIAVSGAGDVNADGYDDIIVGAESESQTGSPDYCGRAYVFCGASGSLLYGLNSLNEETSGRFGGSVSELQDVDGDGISDLIVGARYEDPGTSPTDAGRAYVFSGATGTAVHTLSSPNEEQHGHFAISVSGAGDFNGDGLEDVIIGAHQENPGNAPNNAGRAYIFDGNSGEMLRVLCSPSEQVDGRFGCAVSSAGNADGDDYSAVIVGARRESPNNAPEGAGRAHVFSGPAGTHLFAFDSPNELEYGNFGASVVLAGDVNGDGWHDVVVGADHESPGSSPPGAGRAYVFSGFSIPVELSAFEAIETHVGIQINWRTETEHDCFGFHLYRQSESDDRRQQLTKQSIPGAGTSSIPHDYHFLDAVTKPDTYRYWLEEIAEDGERTEYGPVEVTIRPTSLALNGPYPNPVRENAELRLFVPDRISRNAELQLFDLEGRQIGGTITTRGQLDNTIYWNAAATGIAPGVYRWRLRAGGESAWKPMVVVR